MHENDSIRNLAEVMVNSCGIDRAQANAAVNAIERTRHNQFGTIGKFKEATETENGRKELIDIPHLGPKRLGYLMRALHFIDDDEMLPGFIRITDEFGYSRLFKKELLESMDVEMFDIEKPDDLE